MKQAWIDSLDEQLRVWEQELEGYRHKVHELKAKAEQVDDDTRRVYEQHLQEIEKQIDDAQRKLAEGRAQRDRLAEAGEEAWDEMKEGAIQAWDDFKSGATRAWRDLKSSLDSAASSLRDRS